jgi:hypothetical protein
MGAGRGKVAQVTRKAKQFLWTGAAFGLALPEWFRNGRLNRIATGVHQGKTAERIVPKNPPGNFCRVVILEVGAFSLIICLTAMSNNRKPLKA